MGLIVWLGAVAAMVTKGGLAVTLGAGVRRSIARHVNPRIVRYGAVVALVLLGLGWSCGLIAGSTLVTESVDADVRPTAQGGTDLLMGLGAAVAGVIGGPLLAVGGFGLVSGVSAALVLPLAVVWVRGVRLSGRGSS